MSAPFSRLCVFIGVGKALISSLKVLKSLSQKKEKKLNNQKALDILMFWSLFAFFSMWENSFEFILKRFPGYHYCKAAFVLIISFPQLKITNLVFKDILVPFINKTNAIMQTYFKWELFISIPEIILLLIFPAFYEVMAVNESESFENKTTSKNDESNAVVGPARSSSIADDGDVFNLNNDPIISDHSSIAETNEESSIGILFYFIFINQY
jgi:hypothetical protein